MVIFIPPRRDPDAQPPGERMWGQAFLFVVLVFGVAAIAIGISDLLRGAAG